MSFLIVGLGNPGEQYSHNRHNVGFHVIEKLSTTLEIKLKKKLFAPYLISKGKCKDKVFYLVKPLTYMNKSGEILKRIIKKNHLSLDELIIVCDNMDLMPGSCRFKLTGSTSAHNGIASIMKCLGTGFFKRMYIGIGRPEKKENIITHVLGNPSDKEKILIKKAVDIVVNSLLDLSEITIEQVMSKVNKKQKRKK